jgi:hypothetical protein
MERIGKRIDYALVRNAGGNGPLARPRWSGMNWTGLAQNRDNLNLEMDFRVS